MRAPTHLPTPTRRGLQHVFQRAPLISTPPKSVQHQAQGLKIATAPSSTPLNTTVGNHVVRLALNEAVAPPLFARAWAQLRATFAQMWPSSVTVTTAATVMSMQPMEVAACEAFPVTEADAVSALLNEVSLSEQPLIFSAHSIESYLASRNSEPTQKDPSPSSKRKTRKSSTQLLQSVVRRYLLRPVVNFNTKVIETTQQTFGSITVFSKSASHSSSINDLDATESTKAHRQTNWVQAGLTLATILVVYDVAIVAVYYAFMA